MINTPWTVMNTDIAWAAGLFEGEGTICVRRTPKQKSLSRHIALASTDHDVVERFAKIVKYGTVMAPYKAKSGKPVWKWSCGYYPDVVRVLRAFYPLLGERRRHKADEMFANPAKYQRKRNG